MEGSAVGPSAEDTGADNRTIKSEPGASDAVVPIRSSNEVLDT